MGLLQLFYNEIVFLSMNISIKVIGSVNYRLSLGITFGLVFCCWA